MGTFKHLSEIYLLLILQGWCYTTETHCYHPLETKNCRRVSVRLSQKKRPTFICRGRGAVGGQKVRFNWMPGHSGVGLLC